MVPQLCDAFQGKLTLLIFVIIVAGLLYYFITNFGADKKVPIGALNSDGDAEQLRRNTKKLEEVVEQQMEMTPELAMHIEPSLEEVKQDSELGKEIEDGGAGDSLDGEQETARLTNCPDRYKIEIMSKKQDNAPEETIIQKKEHYYSCCLSYIDDSSDDESILPADEEQEANNDTSEGVNVTKIKPSGTGSGDALEEKQETNRLTNCPECHKIQIKSKTRQIQDKAPQAPAIQKNQHYYSSCLSYIDDSSDDESILPADEEHEANKNVVEPSPDDLKVNDNSVIENP